MTAAFITVRIADACRKGLGNGSHGAWHTAMEINLRWNTHGSGFSRPPEQSTLHGLHDQHPPAEKG